MAIASNCRVATAAIAAARVMVIAVVRSQKVFFNLNKIASLAR
jgi:hypothetical protein